MAGMAVKLVEQYLETKKIHSKEIQENVLMAGFKINNGTIDIFLNFDETDTHVHLIGCNFIVVPENKYSDMYKVVNECNATYAYVKFVLNEEQGQVTLIEDDVIQLDSCGLECYELLDRMVAIVDDVYPKLMKAIWA